MQVTIYSDGGADPNPGIGGWAAILRYGRHEKILTGNDPQTTNNRMELQAALSALQALTRPSEVQFYTDSEYLRKGITEWIEKWAAKGWRRGSKPVANQDLWQPLWKETRRHTIDWHWVKGHAGDRLNERVDELARQARLEITPEAAVSPDIPRLYVRASCKGNPGPGGWGAVLEEGGETEQASGWDLETTNNRMELTAVLEGLRLAGEHDTLQIFTTSDYLFQGATKWIHGWRRRDWQKKDGQPVANRDLWLRLDKLSKNKRLIWVPAKGDQSEPVARPLDEAGQLAVAAADAAAAERT